jgi:hypothetical protein
MINSESIALLLADFYALSMSALLEYTITSIPAFLRYSSDADVDNA